MSSPAIVKVDAHDLRKLFNDGRFVERARLGELAVVLLDDRHPSSPRADEPYCTQSQMLSYRQLNGIEVARAHQYLRPDGSIGASGRPDPKKVHIKGKIFQLPRKSKAVLQ